MNLFNDNVMQKGGGGRREAKQITLGRFLFKEKSSGCDVNEPQPSTSGFQMKEG
jgi:hypothetical protein